VKQKYKVSTSISVKTEMLTESKFLSMGEIECQRAYAACHSISSIIKTLYSVGISTFTEIPIESFRFCFIQNKKFHNYFYADQKAAPQRC
jgi:hypothetical protein